MSGGKSNDTITGSAGNDALEGGLGITTDLDDDVAEFMSAARALVGGYVAVMTVCMPSE